MQLARHFTKVHTKPRKPLRFLPFLHALDDVIVQDVRFALTGEETPRTDGISQTPKKAQDDK